MKRTIKKIYKSLQEKVLKQLNRIQDEDNQNSVNQNSDPNSEDPNSQSKIPSFFLLLLDLKSEGQLEIFEDHMKDPEVKEKLKIALTEMIESYKTSQDTDIAIAFLKNVKDLTKSFAKKKWGTKFIKECLIPSVFQVIILSSESSIDQELVGKALQSLDTCLGQNLSLSDVMSNQTQEVFKIQQLNEANKFYFINVFPSLLEYLKFEQKSFLVELLLQQTFNESIPEVDYKNIGEYLPSIKSMISPLQFYMKELAYFKRIDEDMKLRQYELLQMGGNALFLKKVYQTKYFKTLKIHATHYLKGNNRVKIEKEDIINKIKQEGECCFQIFRILIKLIEQFIEGASAKEEYRQKLMISILECLFFFNDNMELQEYTFKRKYLNVFVVNCPFIEQYIIETIPLLFQNYSQILSQNSNFDYVDYFTKHFISICKLINVSPQKVEEILNIFLSSDMKKVKESINWLNQIPQFVSYMEEQKYQYNKDKLCKQIERIIMRRPQLHAEDQIKINEKQFINYFPNKSIMPRQEFLDEYYNYIKHKSQSKKWREREESVLLLKDLITYMDIRSLFVSVVPDFFDFCSDKIAQVRTVAAWEVDSLFARLPPRSPVSNIFYHALIENVNAFYFSATYQLRQVFVIMCASLMQKNSRIFLSYFYDKFASLAEDRVANVRISVAKTIAGHIKNKQPLAEHKTTKKLVALLKNDPNKDVSQIVAEFNSEIFNWDEDQEYDSKQSDDGSNTQLNKNEVDLFTKGSSLNSNILTTESDADPFDILLNDSSPKLEGQVRKNTQDSFHDYMDEKLPTHQYGDSNQDQIAGSPITNNHSVFSLLDDFHEETPEEHNKIANLLQKEVEEEEKWPEQQQQQQEQQIQQQQQQQQQTAQEDIFNEQNASKIPTPIDLLDDLDDIFPSNAIEQRKMSPMNDISTQEMIQTTN